VELLEALAEISRAKPPIRLDIGEPDVKPPEGVLESLRGALDEFGYGPPEGVPELREAIAELFKAEPSEVAVVAGGRHGIAALMWAFRKRRIITTRPYYPGYFEIASTFDIRVELVEAREEEGWAPRFVERGVYLVNYPNNPTGVVLARDKVRELVDAAEFVVSDEVYRDIAFAPFTSPRDFSGDVAVVYSFSKVLSVPGFRLGAVVAPRAVVKEVVKFVRATVNSAPTVLQRAVARVVPEIPSLAKRLGEVYRRRLEVAKRELRYPFVEPGGSFYVFPKVPCSGVEFMRRALAKGVSVLPGESFGASNHVRVALVQPEERLADALKALNAMSCG
jgi:aspartate aminotransferase